MMSEPGRYLEAFRLAGADGCTVHVEVGSTATLDRRGPRLGTARRDWPPIPTRRSRAVAPFLGDVDLCC